MIKGETVLTGGKHPDTELAVFHSGAGWYVGFADKDGSPYCRETVYFDSYDEATAFWLKVRR